MSENLLRVAIYPERDHFSRCYVTATEVAERAGLDSRRKFHFAVCVSEAYTNAFLHGNRSDAAKCVDLTFCWDDTRVYVDVEDHGSGTVDALSLLKLRPDIETEKSCGRGIGIIKKFADKLEIEERREGGLRVRITFCLRAKVASADLLSRT